MDTVRADKGLVGFKAKRDRSDCQCDTIRATLRIQSVQVANRWHRNRID